MPGKGLLGVAGKGGKVREYRVHAWKRADRSKRESGKVREYSVQAMPGKGLIRGVVREYRSHF